MDAEFLSIKELSTILGVHEVTIRRAIKNKLIPFIRIGNKKKSPYRISKKVVESIHIEFLKGFLPKT